MGKNPVKHSKYYDNQNCKVKLNDILKLDVDLIQTNCF